MQFCDAENERFGVRVEDVDVDEFGFMFIVFGVESKSRGDEWR